MSGVIEPLRAFQTLSGHEVVAAMQERGPVLDEVRRLVSGYAARMEELERRGQVPADVLKLIAPRWPIEAVVRVLLIDVVRQFPANDNHQRGEP